MVNTRIRFSFGKNWKRFIEENFNRERIEIAKKSLKNFLHLKNLEGKTFLDVGCGSGLFSLAAFELGATLIVSFDYDIDAVSCCQTLHNEVGAPARWKVCQGSVLNIRFLESIGKFDIIYSWGVFHHTGAMWQALENTSSRVKEDGLFYFALYNRYEASHIRNSQTWWQVKRFYNHLPLVGKKLMEWGFIFLWFTTEIIKGKNPFNEISSYGYNMRGMDWRRDITDWVGGWPYEFASPDEVDIFMKNLGWELVRRNTTTGWGCNEYLYRRLK